MSLKNLVQGIGRLSLSGLSKAHCHCPCVGNAFTSAPIASVQTTFIKSLSTSNCLYRKLDSRAYPRNEFPGTKNSRWVERKPFHEMYEYTTRPLPFPKTGGRGPNGRVWNHRRGGGHKRRFRMIDWVRGGSADGPPMEEKVARIVYDPNRSSRIALVARENHKRYIIASQNMKAGDVIKSSRQVLQTAVRPSEGDSYPLGSLPVGTLVHCVELFPGHGGRLASAAGTTAQLVRKLGDQAVVRMPSKREVLVSSTCTATVGRVSNVDHNKRVIGKAGRNRWFGIRPRSGRWHRKTGRFGRKIKPVKAMVKHKAPPVRRSVLKHYYSL